MMTNEDKVFLEDIKEQLLKKYESVRIRLIKINDTKVVTVDICEHGYNILLNLTT